MLSTLVYSERSGRLIVSKTLQETAIALTDMRGCFHVNDILFALQSQGITSITAVQVRGQLYYDGSFYCRQLPADNFRRFVMLRQLQAGWFCWEWFEYHPDADAEKGEFEIAPVFPGQKVK